MKCYRHTYQIDSSRWFPLNLRKSKASKKAQKARPQQQSRSQTYEDDEAYDSEGEPLQGSKKDPTPSFDEPEEFAPRARYNAMTCVQKGILYIYGGILEVEDKEYTLDDFWSINVEKMTEYTCMKSSELDEQVWLGEQSDDDDEDDDDDDDEEDDDDEGEDDDVDMENASANEDDRDNESTGNTPKSSKKKKKEKEKVVEIEAVEEEVSDVPSRPLTDMNGLTYGTFKLVEEDDQHTQAINKLNQLLEQDVSGCSISSSIGLIHRHLAL